jgi:hypothetical protein
VVWQAASSNVAPRIIRVIFICPRSNIVISRNRSAYFFGLPLISTGNAEERSAFFGGSLSQNRCSPEGRKAIFSAGAAAQVARSVREVIRRNISASSACRVVDRLQKLQRRIRRPKRGHRRGESASEQLRHIIRRIVQAPISKEGVRINSLVAPKNTADVPSPQNGRGTILEYEKVYITESSRHHIDGPS